MLTPAQRAARDGKLTASRIKVLMTGDEQGILNLWREMVGDPDYEPEDVGSKWQVRLGEATEALHLEWYERETGHKLTRHGEVVVHPEVPWAACTLDAWDTVLGMPVEAKHVGGYEKRIVVIERYQPQCQWQAEITRAPGAILSLIEGNKEPVQEPIAADKVYVAEMWRRAHAFMRCVWDLTPPVEMAPLAVPVRPGVMRTIDLDALGDPDDPRTTPWPNWAYTMRTDLIIVKSDIGAAKRHALAVDRIKGLLPDDVGHLSYDGIVVRRDKRGVSIKLKGEK